MNNYTKGALVLAFVLALAILLANTTLFEDGSIQFFHKAGWGFCLIRDWGCS